MSYCISVAIEPVRRIIGLTWDELVSELDALDRDFCIVWDQNGVLVDPHSVPSLSLVAEFSGFESRVSSAVFAVLSDGLEDDDEAVVEIARQHAVSEADGDDFSEVLSHLLQAIYVEEVINESN